MILISEPDDLARALRERRLARGEPLWAVADRAGMSLQQLHCYERGVNRPGLAVLLRLAKALEWNLLIDPGVS